MDSRGGMGLCKPDQARAYVGVEIGQSVHKLDFNFIAVSFIPIENDCAVEGASGLESALR